MTTAYAFLSLMICGGLSACWRPCTGEEAFAGFHRSQAFCGFFWGSDAAGTGSPRREALWAADSPCSAVGHAALLRVTLPKTLPVSIYGQYPANPTKAGELAPVDPVTAAMCTFCAFNCRKLERRKCFRFTGAESYLHFTTFHCMLREKMWSLPYEFRVERQKSTMGCFFLKDTPECRVWRIASQQLEAQGHSMKLPGSRSAVTVAFPFTVRVISVQNCCGVYGLMYKQVPKAIRQKKKKNRYGTAIRM